MMNKWIGILLIILRQINTTNAFDEVVANSELNTEERNQVEVRAVFINCEPDEGSVSSDSDSMRFEREELFKHNVLRDCSKKLALTVKITSEPDQSSGDEYLPIEHVFEGTNKKRIRLLDPYILRLRREAPLQAYKLRRVDTISGILVDEEGRTFTGIYKHIKSRIERDIEHSGNDALALNKEVRTLQSFSVTPQGAVQKLQTTSVAITESTLLQSKNYADEHNKEICTNTLNSTLSKRKKRSEHNIVVEEAIDDNKQWNSKENYYPISEPEREPVHGDIYGDRSANAIHNIETVRIPDAKTDERSRQKKTFRSKLRIPIAKEKKSAGKNTFQEIIKTNALFKTKELRERSTVSGQRFEDLRRSIVEDNVDRVSTERDYAVYEIGNPELWYTVYVQLFEKLSTPEGKTVWNDLTKGEQASVSSMTPEWTGQDLNVRYRPAEWISRDEFSLPTASLCLLAPIRVAERATYNDNSTFINGISEDGGYIVVPEEDVMGLKDEDSIINKRNDNISDLEFNQKPEEQIERGRRKVVVRTSRALLGGNEEKVNIAYQGSDKYLTLPHRRPHHAQIDLEARADENELVRIGSSGRIAIAVADSTRRTRTIITLQVGNTGLAAARFRVLTRDCGPALADLVNEKTKPVTTAGPMLIPPRHTRSLRLVLPVEIPIDVAHCSVSLVNDENKSIAVREVSIKKGDRCFCVWHCDCVCLTDDPKLICHEMAEALQSAAGLSNRDRRRHTRSTCYKDVFTINIFVIFTGVILALLMLGFIKAVCGLLFRYIGEWGLDLLIQVPRKIDHYYESELQSRKVEYDCEGYPVHPDTRERSIRLISRPMEFILNTIFFVSVPCVVLYDSIKQMISRCRSLKTQNGGVTSTKSNTKKCFSTQDMQGVATRWRRRRGGLRRWMTPQAQELSKELWKEGIAPPVKCEFMRPLLRDAIYEGVPHEPQHEHAEHDSCVDSEQDDTDYVLTQMQKSRESLSILKQKSKS